ncbi:MAG: DUF4430 domain-containing protein [Actinomycetota bacterium]|nr:DUF4430 domain-containing protein [Actinomycetota bacterium]
MKKRLIYVVLVVLVCAAAISAGLKGCTLMPWNSSAEKISVHLLLTRDFGRSPLKESTVRVKQGETVIDALKAVADVRTSYGGGFVSAIDGLGSSVESASSDWFYYVNGILPNRGSDSFSLKDGDFVWWDYHSWDKNNFIPAVVGMYPAPFYTSHRGEKPIEICFDRESKEIASRVRKFFRDKGLRVSFKEGIARVEADVNLPTMVFARAENPQESIQGLAKNRKRNGMLIALEGGKIIPVNEKGELENQRSVSGAIVAVSSGLGDESPLWLILTTGGKGERTAAKLLTSRDGLYGNFGVFLSSDGKVHPLPSRQK